MATCPDNPWREAHRLLVEYHHARSSGAVRSVLDRKWREYLAGLNAASVLDLPSPAASGPKEDA